MPYGIIRRTVFFESVFTQSSPFLATRNNRGRLSKTWVSIKQRARPAGARSRTFSSSAACATQGRALLLRQGGDCTGNRSEAVLSCTLTLASGSSGACSRRRHHRGDHHTPPGRSPELASEKCTCTTRQPPASL